MRRRYIPRPSTSHILIALALIALALLIGFLLDWAFAQMPQDLAWWSAPRESTSTAVMLSEATATVLGLPTQRPPGAPVYTPTPDDPHPLPPMRTDPDMYTVVAGDTLGRIADRFGVSVELIAQANEVANPNLLAIGQVLTIPVPTPAGLGPDFKIVPDSEMVYGPATILFDIDAFVLQQSGYLAKYQEDVEDNLLSGAQIVQRIAQDYSVNPRLLLAVLQYQSGWLTNSTPDQAQRDYPLGFRDPQRKGLYRQLAWAANNLNRGYYTYRVNGIATWLLSDGSIVPIAPTINPGTAAVQHLFALSYNRSGWERAVSEEGLFAIYHQMFGYPFDYAIEPLLPSGLNQPAMQLPFEPGKVWAFTSGPHGAWGDGSAWGALDFAPPGDQPGCIPSEDWVLSVADGLILRADNGAVIQDLDGDGHEQTGWVVLYMHVEGRDRALPGTYLRTGERVGHPSCEGGVSTGTHVHLARRYNGEWIPADQDIPFVLDGWVSSGAGNEYDGYLERDGRLVEAFAGRKPENEIQR
jgi:LysM repeat protein